MIFVTTTSLFSRFKLVKVEVMLDLLVIVSLLGTIRLGFKYCTANASEGLQVQEPKAEATRVPGRRHDM